MQFLYHSLILTHSSPSAEAGPSRKMVSPSLSVGTLSCVSASDTEIESPRHLPTLTLYPPGTPTSICPSVTPPRSPSLTSWDSWTTIVSSDDDDECSVFSDSCLNDSLSSPEDSGSDDGDDDDEEEEEEEDREAVCVAKCISDTLGQTVSSGIVPDALNDEVLIEASTHLPVHHPTTVGAPSESPADEDKYICGRNISNYFSCLPPNTSQIHPLHQNKNG